MDVCLSSLCSSKVCDVIITLISPVQENYDEVGTLSQEVTEGEKGSIECGAPDGAPKPRIYWSNYQTNKEVALDDRISMSEIGDLHFANVVADDETGYYCFAANDLLGNYMRSPLHLLSVSRKSQWGWSWGGEKGVGDGIVDGESLDLNCQKNYALYIL